MEISTKACGIVDINEEDIITFENGLIGFEEKAKFVLLGNQDESDFLIWLQSVENENLAFVVMQPRFFRPNYKPFINISELDDLGIEKEEDLLLYSILVIPNDVKKMTANLRAPIVINTKNNQAKQVVINDESYSVREYVLSGE